MIRKSIHFLAFSFIFFGAGCQTTHLPTKVDKSPTIKRLTLESPAYQEEILNRLKTLQPLPLPLPTTELGFILYDPKTGEIIEKQNENLAFIPASTTKINTAIASLKILGPTHQFKTSLYYRGKINKGILHGDLYLVGDGDPTFSSSELMALSQTLTRGPSKMSIQKIVGHFYFDDSSILSSKSIKERGDSFASFNSGVSGLSMDFNQFLLFQGPNIRQKNTLNQFTVPDLSLLPGFLLNSMQDLLPLSERQRLPVKDPSVVTSTLFAKFCLMNGLELPTPLPRKLVKGVKLISHHRSPSLLEINERFLEYSNNMIGELLIRTTASRLLGRVVNSEEAAHTIQTWLQKAASVQSPKTWKWIDGSGLSPKNRISPAQFISILKYADPMRFTDRTIESLLPVSGKKGALSNRLEFPETSLRIWAKTGTVDYGSAISGNIYTLKHRRLIFSIMLTDFKKRQEIDQFGDVIPVTEVRSANLWSKKAREIQDRTLQTWAIRY